MNVRILLKICLLMGAMALMQGCKDDSVTDVPTDVVAPFMPAAADDSEEAQLRREFYATYGSFLLFNDTLQHYETGRDVNGEVRYFTELKITHRLLKGGNDIVFVGFPLTSLDRYTPQGATVLPSGDKSVEMVLPAEAFALGTDVESLWKDFEEWKPCQPLTEASKKKVEEGRVEAERNAHPRLTDVMLRILAYPSSSIRPWNVCNSWPKPNNKYLSYCDKPLTEQQR